MSTRDFFTGPLSTPGNATITFPAWPTPYRLISAFMNVTTDGTVQNRSTVLRIIEPIAGAILQQFVGFGIVAASTVTGVTFAQGATGAQTNGNPTTGTQSAVIGIPPDLIIWPTMLVRMQLLNGTAADAMTAVILTIDQEPWRPGYYTPGLPRKTKGRRAPPEPQGEG